MKKIILLLLVLLTSTTIWAQKKEKIKGSKIVIIEKKEVESFDAIEVKDNIEISLIKGDKNGVELEADDNLQDAIALKMNGSVLIISSVKDFTIYKKFNIRVTYTDSLKSVIAKDKSKINALEEIKLDTINFECFDESKMFLNVATNTFTITANDKSRVEINAKCETANLILSQNSNLKALISSTMLKCDLYQKANATIEGDVIDMKLRLDNNSNFTGKKLNTKNLQLTAEGYTKCNIFAETSITIEASGNSEIELYGNPKIDMKQFSDNATLYKKTLK